VSSLKTAKIQPYMQPASKTEEPFLEVTCRPQWKAHRLLASLLAEGRASSGQVFSAPSTDGLPLSLVRWIPAERPNALPEHVRALINNRSKRAERERQEMEFVPVDGQQGQWFCIHSVPKYSGRGRRRSVVGTDVHLYQTALSECDCTDFQTRLRRFHGQVGCKHMINLHARLLSSPWH
jgi:hypothetical protein